MRRLLIHLPRGTITQLFQTRPRHGLLISTQSPFAHAQSQSQIHSITWSPIVPTPPPRSPKYPPETDPFERYDSGWAHTILQELGPVGPFSDIRLTGFVAFRCTFVPCSEARWNEFKTKFERLMLIQWEHEGSESADPMDTRKYFKVFWVEDNELLEGKQTVDLTFLRRKFEKLVDINQRYPEESLHNTIASPNRNAFLYIDDEVIASLLDNKVKGNVPFAHVVQPDFPDRDGNYYFEDPEDPKAHYKVAVELLGWYWHVVGTGISLSHIFSASYHETTLMSCSLSLRRQTVSQISPPTFSFCFSQFPNIVLISVLYLSYAVPPEAQTIHSQ